MQRKLRHVTVVILLVASLGGCGTPRLALSQLPQGVSQQSLDGTKVIAFRRDRDVRVFIADVHHLPGEEKALVWCPSERLLITRTHAEAFDENGFVVGGPASRGLDEVPVEFRRGYIDRTGPDIVGAMAPADRRSFEHEGPWDSGPGTFCEGMQHL